MVKGDRERKEKEEKEGRRGKKGGEGRRGGGGRRGGEGGGGRGEGGGREGRGGGGREEKQGRERGIKEVGVGLTRIEITVDVKPDSLLEKAGRGMRFTKRAVRGDLHRFKAYAEMEEELRRGVGAHDRGRRGEEKNRPEIERLGVQRQIPLEAKQKWLGPEP